MSKWNNVYKLISISISKVLMDELCLIRWEGGGVCLVNFTFSKFYICVRKNGASFSAKFRLPLVFLSDLFLFILNQRQVKSLLKKDPINGLTFFFFQSVDSPKPSSSVTYIFRSRKRKEKQKDKSCYTNWVTKIRVRVP